MAIAIVGVGETDYSFNDPRTPSAMALDAVRRATQLRPSTGT
jgi:hypothetical protein